MAKLGAIATAIFFVFERGIGQSYLIHMRSLDESHSIDSIPHGISAGRQL